MILYLIGYGTIKVSWGIVLLSIVGLMGGCGASLKIPYEQELCVLNTTFIVFAIFLGIALGISIVEIISNTTRLIAYIFSKAS